MKEYIMESLKLLWNHIITIIITLVFMWPFAWLISKTQGLYIYSCVMIFIYWSLIYSDAWDIASKDGRSYSTSKQYKLKGLVIGLVADLLNIILFVLFYMGKLGLLNFDIMNFIYRVWMAMFLGVFEKLGEKGIWVFGLPVLVFPVAATFGYIAGMYKFGILDNIAKLIRKVTREKQK